MPKAYLLLYPPIHTRGRTLAISRKLDEVLGSVTQILGGDTSHRIQGLTSVKEIKAFVAANKIIMDKVFMMISVTASFQP